MELVEQKGFHGETRPVKKTRDYHLEVLNDAIELWGMLNDILKECGCSLDTIAPSTETCDKGIEMVARLKEKYG